MLKRWCVYSVDDKNNSFEGRMINTYTVKIGI